MNKNKNSTSRNKTEIEKIAEFVKGTTFEKLPDEVIKESKRIVLDSIGCALAAMTNMKGQIGLAFGRELGGTPQATVIGFGDKLSHLGAAFANGELINALDMDPILPPGHVTPYVLPGILAIGEFLGCSGRDVILATALAHEISYRLGKALVNQRDIRDGKVLWPAIMGYSSTIFGATAGVAKLRGFDTELMANALGLAGSISPANTATSFVKHAPSTTIKYLLAGWLNLGAITAASMAQLGHRGDIYILDDDWGYWRFIGSSKFEKKWLTVDLGKRWFFPEFQLYKPYPFTRILGGALDALIYIIQQNTLKPEEIEGIHAWVEAFATEPGWKNQVIENPIDAQFSFAHVLSVAAHGIPPGPEWQDTNIVMNSSILKMMEKVTYEVHPGYIDALEKDPRSRLSKVEVKARGKTFSEERLYPKGTPSPIEETLFTTDELIEKFKKNAQRVLHWRAIDPAVNAILKIDEIENISDFMPLISIGSVSYTHLTLPTN